MVKTIFPTNKDEEFVRFSGGKLKENRTFSIEFRTTEIVFFLNDRY